MNHDAGEMNNVAVAITEAFDHTYAQFAQTETSRTEVSRFLLDFSVGTSFYLAFTPEGLTTIRDKVFGREIVRDFVFRLTSAFLVRYGSSDSMYDALNETVAWSFAASNHQGKSQDVNAIPKEISSRMPEYADILSLLQANKWLLTLGLFFLYFRIESVDVSRPSTRQGATTIPTPPRSPRPTLPPPAVER